MKFSVEELTEYLSTKSKYLTSDSFSNPDREYIFLDNATEVDNTIKFRRLDCAYEIFDLNRTKYISFRIPKRLYDIDINNL